MNSRDKKLLKIDVLMAYKTCFQPLYIKWSKYPNLVIRNEIMKIILDHCNKKTTQAIYRVERIKAAKRQKRIKKRIEEELTPEQEKNLFEELVS